MVSCTEYQKLAVEARVPYCNTLGGGGCLACKEDIELEQKMQELQERRRELRTTMNENHDPLILKLPPEVASYIFLLSMGERDTRAIAHWSGGLPTPFLLGAVCSGWRQLARSTPALWTRLVFTLRNSKIMEALPGLVSDWLGRSGGLPLTLHISDGMFDDEPPLDRHGLVIDALNQHSGRWCDVEFNLTSDYLGRLCGSTPPEKIRELSISVDIDQHNLPLTFRMNARPSPTIFKIWGFLLEGVDVAWDNLVHLDISCTTFDGVLQVIRDAALLEMCSLSTISPPIEGFRTPGIIIRHPYLRTLQLSFIEETNVFQKIINSLELPSLESWSIEAVESEENVVDIMTSLLQRSGCSLKTLNMVQDRAPAVEDFERLLQAAPCLQHLSVHFYNSATPVMDNILERISESALPQIQTGPTSGFLSDLQSLQLTGHELSAWACIPLIFRLPHRKLLDLYISMHFVTIGDDVLGELVQLVGQGIKLRIYDRANNRARILSGHIGKALQ